VDDQSTPQHVNAAGDGWAKIAVGGGAAAAIKQDGSLYTWGSNTKGAMGSGATTHSYTPLNIGSESWKDVALGDQYILAVRDDGTLWSAGANDFGQLAQGTADGSDHLTLTQVGSRTDWESVAAGFATSYAIRTDGSLWGCGFNYAGSLGDGTEVERHSLVRIGADSDWSAVEAANNYACGLKTDKSLWAWGYNSYGEVGLSANMAVKSPRRIGALNTWVAAEAGPYHLLALTDTDTFGACGFNSYGQTGIGYAYYRTQPEQVGTVGGWQSVDAGLGHTGAIRTDGTLWMWGRNAWGELGLSDPQMPPAKAPVQVGTSSWSAVACGDNTDSGFTLGIKSDGSLWSWGSNFRWQLGLGDNEDRITPTQVGTHTDWTAIAASDGVGDIGRSIYPDGDLVDFSLALNSSGGLFAWGDNSRGQLGQGTTTVDHARENVACPEPGAVWSKIAVGDDYSMAITDTRHLYAWGGNEFGQLGLGYASAADTGVSSPTGVIGSGWLAVACGSGREGSHTVGIQEGPTPGQGTLWAWGDNATGQLGVGDWNPRLVPTQVGSDTDWVEVAGGASFGDDFTLARKADGTLWAVGGNYRGQLGQHNYIQRQTLVPITAVKVPLGTTPPAVLWSTMAAGTNPFAIMPDGTLWAWGDNSYGQLGMGDPSVIPAGNIFAIMDFIDTTPPDVGSVATLGISASGPWASGSASSAVSVSSSASEALGTSGWSKKPITVKFTATDPNANTLTGAGISRKQYSVTNGISWKVGNSVRISKSGITAVQFRALDRVGNASLIGMRTVKVDTVRPRPSAPYSASVVRGRTVTLKFKVTDIKATTLWVRIVIRNGAGKTVKTLSASGQKPNVVLSKSFSCGLAKGTYRFSVYATDLAGNTQSKVASNRLVVK